MGAHRMRNRWAGGAGFSWAGKSGTGAGLRAQKVRTEQRANWQGMGDKRWMNKCSVRLPSISTILYSLLCLCFCPLKGSWRVAEFLHLPGSAPGGVTLCWYEVESPPKFTRWVHWQITQYTPKWSNSPNKTCPLTLLIKISDLLLWRMLNIICAICIKVFLNPTSIVTFTLKRAFSFMMFKTW